MKKPLTYLNRLFELFAEKTLSGHDQLIMLHLFNRFNRGHWRETVRMSDRELQELCRLHDNSGKPVTLQTIRTARSRLKLKGFIEYYSGNGSSITEYRLVMPDSDPHHTPYNTPHDTPHDTPHHTLENSYIRARAKDVKTLEDVKTIKEWGGRDGERENSQKAENGDAAVEGRGDFATPADLVRQSVRAVDSAVEDRSDFATPADLVRQSVRAAEKKAVGWQADNPSSTNQDDMPQRAKTSATQLESQDIVAEWLKEMPRPPTASEKFGLAELEEKYGFARVKDAIIKTRQDRYYPTFSHIRAVVEGTKSKANSESVRAKSRAKAQAAQIMQKIAKGRTNHDKPYQYEAPPEYDFGGAGDARSSINGSCAAVQDVARSLVPSQFGGTT